ncbi:MAG: hypothetical protein HYT79_04555 [Elusimicrobia bacterium]|nr:hypothetical protein [Elusimicrobiota bacterium]
MPPGTKQIITVYKDRVITKWRDGGRVEYRDRYLPPEGRIDVAIKDAKPELLPEILIRDRGVTHRFGGGVALSIQINPCLQLI